MRNNDRTYEGYLSQLRVNGPIIQYGNFDYTNVFKKQDEIKAMILDRCKKTLLDALKYGELTEKEKSILKGIEFKCVESSSLTANAEIINGTQIVKISTGIIAFLSILNAIAISYFDSMSKLSGDYDSQLKTINNKYAQCIFDTYCYLFDKRRLYPHLVINIPNYKDSFLTNFSREHDIELDPVLASINHQIEFIIFHEIAHLINPQFDEFKCDEFAIKLSRKIWKKNTYHTSYCEFFQLSLFLYYDFHEKYFEVQEQTIKWWNNHDKEFLKFNIYSFNHVRSKERYLKVINQIDNVSELCKILIDITNRIIDFTFDALLYTELEMFHFFNITNIEKQIRIQNYLHNRFNIEKTKEEAEKMKSMINAKIHTSDSQFWFKKLSSPFGLYYIGNIKDSKEKRDLNVKKIASEYMFYSRNLIERFGYIDNSKIENEVGNNFKLNQ